MALKQYLSQKLLQKLSPQQIQLMKLLQVPTVAIEARIKEELEKNPALDEGRDDGEDEFADQDEQYDDSVPEKPEAEKEFDFSLAIKVLTMRSAPFLIQLEKHFVKAWKSS